MSERQERTFPTVIVDGQRAYFFEPDWSHETQGSGSSLQDARDLVVGELLIKGGAEAIKAGGRRTAGMIRDQVAVARAAAGEVVFPLTARRRRP